MIVVFVQTRSSLQHASTCFNSNGCSVGLSDGTGVGVSAFPRRRRRSVTPTRAAIPTPNRIHFKYFAQPEVVSLFNGDCFTIFGHSTHNSTERSQLSITTRFFSKQSFSHFTSDSRGNSVHHIVNETPTPKHHVALVRIPASQTVLPNLHLLQFGTVYSSCQTPTRTLHHRVA